MMYLARKPKPASIHYGYSTDSGLLPIKTGCGQRAWFEDYDEGGRLHFNARGSAIVIAPTLSGVTCEVCLRSAPYREAKDQA